MSLKPFFYDYTFCVLVLDASPGRMDGTLVILEDKTSIPEWTIQGIGEHDVHENIKVFLGRQAFLYPEYGAETEMGYFASDIHGAASSGIHTLNKNRLKSVENRNQKMG